VLQRGGDCAPHPVERHAVEELRPAGQQRQRPLAARDPAHEVPLAQHVPMEVRPVDGARAQDRDVLGAAEGILHGHVVVPRSAARGRARAPRRVLAQGQRVPRQGGGGMAVDAGVLRSGGRRRAS
jgi:hypothetical protein